MTTAMTLLNRAQVLGANDLTFRDVPTPEWAPEGATEEEKANVGVRIRALTGEGRGSFIARSLELKAAAEEAAKSAGLDPDKLKPKVDFEIEMVLIAATAVDGSNTAMFTMDDVKALGQKNAHVIGRLATVAQELSGLNKKAEETAAKNLQPAAS